MTIRQNEKERSKMLRSPMQKSYLKMEMKLKTEAHLSELECLKEERDQNLEENNRLPEILQSQNVEVSLLKEIVILDRKMLDMM